MARYIDVDKLIAEYDRVHIGPPGGARKLMVEAPAADVVEVVRCKDCGSYNKNYGECTLNGSHFGENGYCCRGTRTPKERGVE